MHILNWTGLEDSGNFAPHLLSNLQLNIFIRSDKRGASVALAPGIIIYMALYSHWH